jgi:two-component system alkaline phosphatase synthesis response regulator PhoP
MEHTRVKLLLVDDEPDIIEFLSYNFLKASFEVSTATNGKEGFDRACALRPDVIIADILMPELNGIDMCKLLRMRKEFDRIPFLFLSAVNDDYQVMHAMLAGGDQYVNKPVRFEYLLKLVRDLSATRPDPLLHT